MPPTVSLQSHRSSIPENLFQKAITTYQDNNNSKTKNNSTSSTDKNFQTTVVRIPRLGALCRRHGANRDVYSLYAAKKPQGAIDIGRGGFVAAAWALLIMDRYRTTMALHRHIWGVLRVLAPVTRRQLPLT